MRSGAKTGLGLGLALCLTFSAGAAPNWKTLTDAPRNTNGSGRDITRPLEVPWSGGSVHLALPGDGWVVNQSGAMGADKEYFNEENQARLGVWAGDSLNGKNPRALVGEWTTNIKGLTGGEWTAPKAKFNAGTPVVEATGVDVYGNYFYRVIAFTKFGVNYALALRTPYENRWNRNLDSDISYIISESHLSHAAMKGSK